MTIADLWVAFRYGFLPCIGFILTAALILYFAAHAIGKCKTPQKALLILSFCTLGGVLGFSAGNSREPAVTALLPALLTFLTVLLGYAFGRELGAQMHEVIPYCMLAVLLTGFYGLFAGVVNRGKSEDYNKAEQRQLLRYEAVDLPLEKARQLIALEEPGQRERARRTEPEARK